MKIVYECEVEDIKIALQEFFDLKQIKAEFEVKETPDKKFEVFIKELHTSSAIEVKNEKPKEEVKEEPKTEEKPASSIFVSNKQNIFGQKLTVEDAVKKD